MTLIWWFIHIRHLVNTPILHVVLYQYLLHISNKLKILISCSPDFSILINSTYNAVSYIFFCSKFPSLSSTLHLLRKYCWQFFPTAWVDVYSFLPYCIQSEISHQIFLPCRNAFHALLENNTPMLFYTSFKNKMPEYLPYTVYSRIPALFILVSVLTKLHTDNRISTDSIIRIRQYLFIILL